jgi:hypothetical protein
MSNPVLESRGSGFKSQPVGQIFSQSSVLNVSRKILGDDLKIGQGWSFYVFSVPPFGVTNLDQR